MPLGRVCSRRMATIDTDGTVEEAAVHMARLGVDTLVVVDEEGSAAGVVTDRDLVVRCLARALPPRETFVGEIMTSPLPPGISLHFLELGLRRHRERDALVVNGEYETLQSLLALDDAIHMVDRELERRGGSDGRMDAAYSEGEDGGGVGPAPADPTPRPVTPQDALRDRRSRPRRSPPAADPPRAWE